MKIEYRRNLPHLQYVGATFFITFCLKGSLPPNVIHRLIEERQNAIGQIRQKPSGGSPEEEIQNEHKRYFAKIDKILDTCQSGLKWLSEPKIAELVAAAIKSPDGKNYDLIAYCIMPNHVHLIVDSSIQLENLAGNVQLTDQNYKQLFTVLQQIKDSTAYQANKILGRSGAFWQPESYDHVVRNQQELKNIVNYTLQNSVKAGLVDDWRNWPFSFLNERTHGL